MEIRRIALNGWRNYDFASAEFSPGTNVISGENAQGKTNLLEAVYMLTGGRSFRTRFDRELIGFDCSAGEILADVFAHGREQTVKITLRRGQRKQILQNGVKARADREDHAAARPAQADSAKRREENGDGALRRLRGGALLSG